MEPSDLSKSKESYEQIGNLYLFAELYKFITRHSGLALTIAYIVLTLSSMVYLSILYNAFDVPILSIVALEDILATPFKNPNIIAVFLVCITALVLLDYGTRWYARLQSKLSIKEQSIWIKALRYIFWVPKSRSGNIKLTLLMIILFLSLYVILFAKEEARLIKEGKGDKIVISLSDQNDNQTLVLIGIVNQFVVGYNEQDKKTIIYNVETIDSIAVLPKKSDEINES